MKKLYSFMLMLFVTMVAFAQSITVDRVSVSPGGTATVTVNISGASQFIAAGMYVELPKGFTFVYDDEEEAYTVGGDVFAKTHSITDNLQQENVLKFAIVSSKNAAFKKDSGTLFSFTVACGDNVGGGTHIGLLKTIEFSNTANQLVKTDNVTFSFAVNGGGTVDPDPVDPTPIDPTPVDPTPSDTTQVDPQPSVQVVAATDIAVKQGGQATGVLNLTNATQYIAAGMFIELPQGFTFVYDDEEEGFCVPGTVFSKTHSIADNLQAENKLKFAVTSAKNAAFKTDEGSLLSFTISCGASVAPGTYTGKLSSIEFSKVGSELLTQNDVPFTITVSRDDTPIEPAPTVASLTASGMSLVAGTSTATGVINIKNASNYIAAGMFISLPEGFTFVYNDEQEGFCVPGDVLSSSHGIVDNLQKANNLKFAVTSVKNAAFKDNGTLASYTIACDASVAAGIYTGTIKKIELSELDNSLVTLEDITFPITVTANTNPEPTPVDPEPANVVSISKDMTVYAGSQVTATISIEDASKYIAAGMYISLPNGFSFVYNDDEECYCVPGDVFTKTHSIADNLQQGGLLKFAITSMKNSAFKEVADGSLVSFTIACDPMTAAGTYTGYISSIELSEVGSTLHKENDIAFTITVAKEEGQEKEYTPATVIAKSYTRTYGDENPDFGFLALGGDIDGTPEITCTAMATSAVGTYPIRIKQGSMKNKKVTFVEGTLTIIPAPLYISGGEYMMFEGKNLPAMNAQYFGFKNNDSEDALAVKPTLTSDVTTDSKPGAYNVEVSGAASQNYAINYINGTITVYSVGDLDGDGKFSVDDVMQFIDLYLLNDTLGGK